MECTMVTMHSMYTDHKINCRSQQYYLWMWSSQLFDASTALPSSGEVVDGGLSVQILVVEEAELDVGA